MLRRREWGDSILPAPYTDNGIEINGSHWFGESVQLDYAAYVVSGLKGNDDGFDLDFIQSRAGSLYYVDNNAEPSVGGRIAMTTDFGADVGATLGVSAMYGHYDPSAELSYFIGGADLYLRIAELTFRAEYLIRRTEFALGNAPEERFRYEISPDDGNFSIKDGFYAEIEHPLTRKIDSFFRFDGMRRRGNILINSPLRRRSHVLRYTAGGSYSLVRGFRIKFSAELWDFSNFEPEVGIHTGVTANF